MPLFDTSCAKSLKLLQACTAGTGPGSLKKNPWGALIRRRLLSMAGSKLPFGSASACCCFACSFGKVWGCEVPCVSLYCGRGQLHFTLCCCCVNNVNRGASNQPQAQWQIDCCLCRCALGYGDGSRVPGGSTSTVTAPSGPADVKAAPGVPVMERSQVSVTPIPESTTK